MADSIEKKIIEATINCIEKYTIEQVTNDKIAKEAGVNSAAISYYFRGKDNLIRIAQEVALQNGFDWNDYLYAEEYNAKEQLKEIIYQITIGAYRFPNLTKSFFTDAFLKSDYSGLGIKKLNEFLQTTLEKISKKAPNISLDKLRNIIYYAFCGIILPIVSFPSLVKESLGDMSCDEKMIRKNLDSLFDLIW